MSTELVVVARWQTTPDALASVLTQVNELRQRSLEEPGCLGYEVFQALDEPATLLLLERYRDAAAIDAHRNSPHYRTCLVERILPLLTERRVEILNAAMPD